VTIAEDAETVPESAARIYESMEEVEEKREAQKKQHPREF